MKKQYRRVPGKMKTADIPPAGGKRDRIGCDYTLFRRLSGIYAYTINLAGYCCGSNAGRRAFPPYGNKVLLDAAGGVPEIRQSRCRLLNYILLHFNP
ncbi:TPA: hypothetical protein ACJJRR_001139, partial [Neisseria meningitidis]